MDRKCKRYLLKQMTGRTSIARIVDAILGSAFIFIALFLILWQTGVRVIQAAILAACIAALVRLFIIVRNKNKFEKYVNSSVEKLRRSLTIERLLLSSSRGIYIKRCLQKATGKESLQKKQGGYAQSEVYAASLCNYPKQPATEQQLFEIYSKARRAGAASVYVLCTSDFSSGAREFALRKDIKLIEKDVLIEMLKGTSLEASKSEAMDALEAQAKVRLTREQFKQKLLNRSKTKAYALCAVLLTFWSFIVGFSIVYPLMASMCVAMAFYSYASGAKSA